MSQATAAHRITLVSAASTLGLDLADAQIDLLLAYMDWLHKWNKVYNLTALRHPDEMLSHHLIDSLTAVGPLQRHIASQRQQGALPQTGPVHVLDVGSGGGLPGVVLAICLPDVRVTCVDTVNKKAAFIQQVAVALRLPNLKGLHARVETVQGGFDVVTSRAFASLVDFTAWSRKALQPGAVWMAMKGKHPTEELAALAARSASQVGAGVDVFHVEPLHVPGLDAERCMVWMRPAVAA
jgi:16S rRNA (guanine527-N7)-methyltransferase